MSTYDDDHIEFDFFDEPETKEASTRRRLPGRSGGGKGDGPKKPPRPPATGVVPLVRLAGLVALAIVLVVVLVSWIGACQGKSKQAEYSSYMDKVRAVAVNDRRLGIEFSNKLISPALKQSQLQTALEQYAQQEQQAYDQAQQIRPPGPLRAIHQNLVNAIELRAKGLAGLANAFSSPGAMKDATTAAEALTAQAALLNASDVVWDQLFRLPANAAAEERRRHRRRRAELPVHLEPRPRQRARVHDRRTRTCTARRPAARRAASTATRSSRPGRRRRASTSRPRRRRP